MDHEKNGEGEPCCGVIKKLFPTKRYGFAVCECDNHTGEAHFNYSDLDIPDEDRGFLVVGWRIQFKVNEQSKKTDHCDFRATHVKPVTVMVVQCEVQNISGDLGTLLCRELSGRCIYVTRDKYNGKFDSEAAHRGDTCRAAVTWVQMKQQTTYAIHCSQDVPIPHSTPSRKHKTPEKRARRDPAMYNRNSFNEAEVSSIFSEKPSKFGHPNEINDSGLCFTTPQSYHTNRRSSVLSTMTSTPIYLDSHKEELEKQEGIKKKLPQLDTSRHDLYETFELRKSFRRNLDTEFNNANLNRNHSVLPRQENDHFEINDAFSRNTSLHDTSSGLRTPVDQSPLLRPKYKSFSNVLNRVTDDLSLGLYSTSSLDNEKTTVLSRSNSIASSVLWGRISPTTESHHLSGGGSFGATIPMHSSEYLYN